MDIILSTGPQIKELPSSRLMVDFLQYWGTCQGLGTLMMVVHAVGNFCFTNSSYHKLLEKPSFIYVIAFM